MKIKYTNEFDLIDAFKKGHTDALEQVYKENIAAIIIFLEKFTGAKMDAEDLAQETFITAWKERHQVREKGSIKPFLYLKASQAFLRSLHLNQRWQTTRYGYFLIKEKYESMVIKQVFENELHSLIGKLMDSLSQQQRRILYMKFEQNMSINDIAQKLNTSVNTVSVQKFRALKTLLNVLNNNPRAKHDIDNILFPLVLLVLSCISYIIKYLLV